MTYKSHGEVLMAGVDNMVNIILGITEDLGGLAANGVMKLGETSMSIASSVGEGIQQSFGSTFSSTPGLSPSDGGIQQARGISDDQAPLATGKGEDLNAIASNRDRMPEIAACLNSYNYDVGQFAAVTPNALSREEELGVA